MTSDAREVSAQDLPRIFEIAIDVDKALPKHGRGVVAPQEMAATQTASCFGRLAVVGSQLVEEGLSSEDLHWLISLSHGMEFTKGKPWLGHAMLVVEKPEPILMDSSHYMWSRQLSSTSWRASQERNLHVVDNEALANTFRNISAPSGDRPQQTPLDHLRQQALHFVFTQHEFHEGIASYQAEHPRLSAHDPVQASDYANFYAGLGDLDLSDQASPPA